MTERQGLLMKYFVLKPAGSDIYAIASRKAMTAYAESISSENPQFSNDLLAWVRHEEDVLKI